MNDPSLLDPDSIVSPGVRRSRLVDRYETGVALLVAVWTIAFIARSRLAFADRLSDVANEALMSLLIVVPVMLAGWGAMFMVDRRLKLGTRRGDRR